VFSCSLRYLRCVSLVVVTVPTVSSGGKDGTWGQNGLLCKTFLRSKYVADQQTFKVEVLPDTLIRRSSGSITGHIWITIGDWGFPSQGWDDFPVVILSWWIEALLSLSAGENDRARFSFMDGPYFFEIAAPVGDVCSVSFYRNGQTGSELLREQSCQFGDIRKAVLSAARTTIDACQEKKWVSTDLNKLISTYSN